MKNMRPALYFIVGDTLKEEWHHFALNFDVYTHFTSPIRFNFYITTHNYSFLYKEISGCYCA